MSKVKCEVVRDLMALVADEVASEESKKLVKEHLEDCQDCKRIYEIMTRRIPKPEEDADSETKFIRFCKKLEKKFRWQKALLWMLIAVVIVAIVCGGYFMISTPPCVEMPSSWLDMTVEADENGWVVGKFTMLDGHKWYDCGWSGHWDHGFYYIIPEKPLVQIGDNGGESEFYYRLDSLRVVDGKLQQVEEYWNSIYDDELGSYVDDIRPEYTPVAEVRLGTPEDYKTVWMAGDAIEVVPRLTQSFQENP